MVKLQSKYQLLKDRNQFEALWKLVRCTVPTLRMQHCLSVTLTGSLYSTNSKHATLFISDTNRFIVQYQLYACNIVYQWH